MGKICFLVLILSFSLPLRSQNLGRDEQSTDRLDHGANKIMDEVSRKYQAYTTIKIDFTYKTEKEGKVIDTQKGKMTIKGSCYYFSFAGQEFFCDAETIWNYQKESQEITIFEYDEEDEDIMLNPAKLLLNWKSKFKAKLIREENEKGKTLILIDVTPLEQQSFYKIRLFIDKSKNEIVRFVAYEKDNTTFSYIFDTFSVNTPVSDHFFKLDPASYPNATINDMR